MRVTPQTNNFETDIVPALIALYRHILPNVPVEDLERDIMDPNSVHLVVCRKEQDVRQEYYEKPARLLRRYETRTGMHEDYSEDSDPDEADGTETLLRVEDFVKNRRKTTHDKFVRQKYPGLIEHLKGDRNDLDTIDAARIPIRFRDLLIGAATFRQTSLQDFPQTSVCYLLYIGVRTRFQLVKVGRRLLQTIINVEAKACDVFFTFAGTDAVRFFRSGGLTDDPLICGRFQSLDADWTDAVPMARILRRETRKSTEVGENLWTQYKQEAYRRYSQEAFFVKELIEENAELRKRLAMLERMQETNEQQIALEKSRCVMYEQMVQSLESQLLVNGIKPRVNQDEIVARVV